jgi:Flp pilus assembly protein TadG
MKLSLVTRRRVERSSNQGERGFVLVACMVCAVVLFGMAGLAIDMGRMYITKNEAQSFGDSAALYAAQQLDGTTTGLTNADNAVATNPNKWNFGTSGFSGTITEYSADGATGWQTSDKVTALQALNIRYVRVTPVVNNVALFFLPVTGTANTATVKAQSVGGQVLLGCTSCTAGGAAGGGMVSGTALGGAGASPTSYPVLFPYSPIANVDATSSSQLPTSGDPFGFTPGQQYDLKWPSSPTLGKDGNNKVPCAGDNNQTMLNHQMGAGSNLGEIVLNSASAITTDIVTLDDAVGVSVSIDHSVNPTTGDKNKEVKALNDRAAQDTDATSTAYASYVGNGRRIITVIVNNGYANSSGTAYSSDKQAIGLGYAQFLLLPGGYTQQTGGNNPWCAIYVGPSPSDDTVRGGSGGNRGRGVGAVRLTN